MYDYMKFYSLEAVMLWCTYLNWNLYETKVKYTHDGGATFIEYTARSGYETSL